MTSFCATLICDESREIPPGQIQGMLKTFHEAHGSDVEALLKAGYSWAVYGASQENGVPIRSGTNMVHAPDEAVLGEIAARQGGPVVKVVTDEAAVSAVAPS